MNLNLPYWVQGAIVRAARTVIATMLAAVVLVPLTGSTVDFVKALILALVVGLLTGIDKALRELRLDKANRDLATDTNPDGVISDAPVAEVTPGE